MYSACDTPLLVWVSPFGYLRIKVCLPTPRSFSQATTSFIACDRQGIHHVHLVAWSYNFASYRNTWVCVYCAVHHYQRPCFRRNKYFWELLEQNCLMQSQPVLTCDHVELTMIHTIITSLCFFQIVKERVKPLNRKDLTSSLLSQIA